MPKKQKRHDTTVSRINEKIKFSPVRVIGADGQPIGVIPTHKALAIARSVDLDLVEVAPQARPPVCHIMDYGKFRYEQGLKEKKQKQSQRTAQIKEVRLGPSIGSHDLDTKIRAIHKFLLSGHKVQVRIQFRKRENAHRDLGFIVINDIIDRSVDLGEPKVAPKFEGRLLICILEPKAKK